MSFYGVDIIGKLPAHVGAFTMQVEETVLKAGGRILGHIVFKHRFHPIHHLKLFFVNGKKVQVADCEIWHPSAREAVVEKKEEDWQLIHRINLSNLPQIAERING